MFWMNIWINLLFSLVRWFAIGMKWTNEQGISTSIEKPTRKTKKKKKGRWLLLPQSKKNDWVTFPYLVMSLSLCFRIAMAAWWCANQHQRPRKYPSPFPSITKSNLFSFLSVSSFLFWIWRSFRFQIGVKFQMVTGTESVLFYCCCCCCCCCCCWDDEVTWG